MSRSKQACFSGCSALKDVELPAGLTEIPEMAFSESGLKSIRIPGSIRVIGAAAFRDCKNLIHLVMEEGVEEVGAEAFLRTRLARTILPASLKKIGDLAFFGRGKAFVFLSADCEMSLTAFGDLNKNMLIVTCPEGGTVAKTIMEARGTNRAVRVLYGK